MEFFKTRAAQGYYGRRFYRAFRLTQISRSISCVFHGMNLTNPSLEIYNR